MNIRIVSIKFDDNDIDTVLCVPTPNTTKHIKTAIKTGILWGYPIANNDPIDIEVNTSRWLIGVYLENARSIGIAVKSVEATVKS